MGLFEDLQSLGKCWENTHAYLNVRYYYCYPNENNLDFLIAGINPTLYSLIP
jgi:hypothetical protein